MSAGHPRSRSINRQVYYNWECHEAESLPDGACAYDWSGAGDACRRAGQAKFFGAWDLLAFISGPAAPYGMLGKDAADLVIDDFNAKGAIEGGPVTPIHVGEAQGAQGVIAEYRRIARKLSELRKHCLAHHRVKPRVA
jgi:hypothetical protein